MKKNKYNSLEQVCFRNKEEFRKWLSINHDKSAGIWMMFYRKHSKKECINYNDALEEALCYGWIDSIIKKIDNDRYVRKFTPRKDISKWSELNKKKVIELIRDGRMTEAGLQKIDVYLKHGKVDWGINKPGKKKANELHIPDFILKELARNEPALTNFNNLAQTYKNHYVLWITNAKCDETIRKRLDESIRLLKENKKLGLK